VERGLSLIELLVSIAIASMLAVPIFVAVRSGASAQAVTGAAIDVDQQARFAMQRMAAAIRRTPADTVLGAKAATTTGDWFSPVMFCLNGAGALVETVPADASCTGTAVIASGVSAFSAQTYAAGAGAAKVIEIQLTVSASHGASTALTSRTRLGGGTL
jgi:prepilin-type N-terminal cleavage/methylation domain-containing protein